MRGKALKILLLTWTIAWFAVILPGHQRGSVTLPGSDQNRVEQADANGSANTSACPLCVVNLQQTDPGEPDLPVPGSCCAICQMIATLNTPPVFAFVPPDIELLDLLAAVESEGIRSGRNRDTHRNRGPPKLA